MAHNPFNILFDQQKLAGEDFGSSMGHNLLNIHLDQQKLEDEDFGSSTGHNLLNLHFDQQELAGEDWALQATIAESLATKDGKQVVAEEDLVLQAIAESLAAKDGKDSPTPSLPEVTPSISTTTSFMVKGRALPALENLYKAINASKSSTTSTSSASVPVIPCHSEDDAVKVAKEQLLLYLSKDVEEVLTFHHKLTLILTTLKKCPDFSEGIRASLNKLQHHLQSIATNVRSCTSSIVEYDEKVEISKKAFEDFQLSLDPYPEIREQADKLATQREALTTELNRIQKELEQVEQEEVELEKVANAILTESEPFKKKWESLSSELPQLEDAKVKAVDSLEESRQVWVGFKDRLSSI
ncbi:uncharacterized protein LOC132282751 isoform X2 [Cornus florida]|uniref:uncharacterized protein LOC132282751 isoform X2 n=1 Tax=Cornus florida TaxID=4283 RepID=UPI002899ADE4|nr:uncharacterized protein LOC132282751 isoform X2 [Cornus florida]